MKFDSIDSAISSMSIISILINENPEKESCNLEKHYCFFFVVVYMFVCLIELCVLLLGRS